MIERRGKKNSCLFHLLDHFLEGFEVLRVDAHIYLREHMRGASKDNECQRVRTAVLRFGGSSFNTSLFMRRIISVSLRSRCSSSKLELPLLSQPNGPCARQRQATITVIGVIDAHLVSRAVADVESRAPRGREELRAEGGDLRPYLGGAR
jgi:hypothetical protein